MQKHKPITRIFIIAFLVLLGAPTTIPVVGAPELQKMRLPALTTHRVSASAYTARVEECDSTPFITASGDSVREGGVAISRDLLRKYPLGTLISIKEHGGVLYIVFDVMGPTQYNRMDFFFTDLASARSWGRRNITITNRGRFERKKIKKFLKNRTAYCAVFGLMDQ